MESKDKIERVNDLQNYVKKEVFTVPNIITMIRIVGTVFLISHLLTLGLAPMTLLGITSPWVLPSLAIGIAATDLLDGFIARTFHCQSKLGGALDAIADKVFNWGIALSVVASGIMPVASLLLLTPTILRDVYVGAKTVKDKIEDGKAKNEKQGEKDKSVVENFKKGDAMSPTMVGKTKMWTMSATIISGLRYGFLMSSNVLFPIFAVMTNGLSVIDIVLTNKKFKEKKKQRLENSLKSVDEEESKNNSLESTSKEKAAEYSEKKEPSNILKKDPIVEKMLEDMINNPSSKNEFGKPFVKRK